MSGSESKRWTRNSNAESEVQTNYGSSRNRQTTQRQLDLGTPSREESGAGGSWWARRSSEAESEPRWTSSRWQRSENDSTQRDATRRQNYGGGRREEQVGGRLSYDQIGTLQHGTRNQGQNRRETVIKFGLLKVKVEATNADAMMFSNDKSFAELLLDRNLSGADKVKWVDCILQILNNAFMSGGTLTGHRENLKTVLLEDSSYFLSQTCKTRFLNELTSGSGMRIDPLVTALVNYLDVFNHLCALDPLVAKRLIKDIKLIKQLMKAEIADYPNLQNIYELYSEATESLERKEKEEKEEALRKETLRKTGRMDTERKPAGDFRNMSVHPTEADLTTSVQLRKHKVKGAFESVDDYLDIQFRLLREDFVATIRQGISEFKKNPTLRGAGRFRSGDVKVYENISVIAPNFARNGLTYSISMDTNNRLVQRIMSSGSSGKRLMTGSLLCLSLDCFNDVNLFATIAEGDEKSKEKGIFEIQFLEESQLKFNGLANQQGPFIAVESTAYFESYAPVLKGMQKLDATNFPLSEYIVSGSTDSRLPKYLKGIQGSYKFITKDHQVTKPVYIVRQSTSSWPTAEDLGLNDSQYEAFKHALTNEFAVIQGPPGTGKTYVGLKIVQALLYNLYEVSQKVDVEDYTILKEMSGEEHHDWQMRNGQCPPRSLHQMLIVCYTNHALDQFLEEMLQFCPTKDIVRVGGGSKSEKVQECLYRNQKGQRSSSLRHAHNNLNAKVDAFKEERRINEFGNATELTESTIRHQDVGGLFLDYPSIYHPIHCIDFYLNELNEDGSRNDEFRRFPQMAMYLWLGYDSETYAMLSEEMQQRGESKNLKSAPAQKIVDDEDSNDEGEEDTSGEEDEEDSSDEDDEEGEEDSSDGKNFDGMEDEEDGEEEEDEEDEENRRRIEWLYSTVGNKITLTDDDGFIKDDISRKRARKRHQQFVSEKLASSDIMTVQELSDLNSQQINVAADLSMSDRWRLYRALVKGYKNRLAVKMSELQNEYVHLMAINEELRKRQVAETLSKAKVIGMTTTGAAKYQDVLQEIAPEIVVIEEAAEVLEAHITTALSKNCQHLILIGDHKQLKPNPTVYDLAVKYHLDLSLFERMVNNGLPVKTLNIQHRMRPEVSKYVRHIYDRLDDHESVQNREPVEGIASPVFFYNHNEPETPDDILMSHSNDFEAKMVVGLTRYLLKQEGYEPEDITILTMYTGQLLHIKNKISRSESQGVRITSVDNFQGEESKIMILSLVRSNKEDSLGFVKIENRVCVALSRAQHGMYVFGNFDMLSRGSALWKTVVDYAKKAKEFGSALVLSCRRHGNFATVKRPEDFEEKAPAGGCKLMCDEKLKCGHVCKQRCHTKDFEHLEYNCTEKCVKVLSCGHPCPNMCHQKCQKCKKQFQTQLPCGHAKTVECHQIQDPTARIPCEHPCVTILKCGHGCAKNCSESCTTECEVKVKQTCSQCSEVKDVKCYIATQRLLSGPESQKYGYECDTPCEEILPCQHMCSGTCNKCSDGSHKSCMKTCGKYFKCGHFCKEMCMNCASDDGCKKCEKRCPLRCSHGVQCSEVCNQTCMFTTNNDTPNCEWGCKHRKCERPCGEPCSHIPCDKWCDQIIGCGKCKQGFSCVGLCGDPCPTSMCPTCDQAQKITQVKHQIAGIGDTITATTRWIMLTDCWHVVPVEYMNSLVYGGNPNDIAKCPYEVCTCAVLNTPRYISVTRGSKCKAVHKWRNSELNSDNGGLSPSQAADQTPSQAAGLSPGQGTYDTAKLDLQGLVQPSPLPRSQSTNQQPGTQKLHATVSTVEGKKGKKWTKEGGRGKKRRKPPKIWEVSPPPLPDWLRLGSQSNKNDLDKVEEEIQRHKAELMDRSETGDADSEAAAGDADSEAAARFDNLHISGEFEDDDDDYISEKIDFN